MVYCSVSEHPKPITTDELYKVILLVNFKFDKFESDFTLNGEMSIAVNASKPSVGHSVL